MPPQQSCRNFCTTHDDVEGHPWKAVSYCIFVIQFMSMTLDLFMDTSIEPAWHYAITSIEIVVSTLLLFYQILRITTIKPTPCDEKHSLKAALLLTTSALMQMALVAIAGYSYKHNEDWAEWTMFGVSLAWGLVNPMTFDAVQAVRDARAAAEDDQQKPKKKHMSWLGACVSVFSRHFSRTPLLFCFATLFAIGQAILGTYQGAVINELTKSVTKGVPSADEVERLGVNLILVWLGANASRFLFDTLSAKMFAKLDNWLRQDVFEKAVAEKDNTTDNSLSPADYQARYASDITGVVGLYGTLLRGVVVNVLLICTNFIFLVYQDGKIATITLGFLAMSVTSGPTDLAGSAARNVQIHVTNGLEMLQEEQPPPEAEEEEDSRDLNQRHKEQVLVPIQQDLFRKAFFSNMVDTFNSFFSSFLTNIVVISMAWQVFYEELDSSQFLGIFFVFKQLQKPATKISGVIKKAVSKTANLERVNAVVFGDQQQDKKKNEAVVNDTEQATADVDENGGNKSVDHLTVSTTANRADERRQSVAMETEDPAIEYLKTESV